MVSPLVSTVVIECPNCGTRYQLPADTIGPQGRQVACAHCGEAWKAKAIAQPEAADADDIFDDAAESELDAQFGAAQAAAAEDDPDREDRERTLAEIRAAVASGRQPNPAPPGPPATGLKRLQRDFTRRQAAANKRLPLARARRVIRLVSVTALVLLIGAGVLFRTDVVRQFPDLAGAYDALGLGVNVVGLEFRDVTTLVTLRNGNREMRVDGRIFSIAARRVAVPRTVVTLLDDNGNPIYEWSIPPEVPELQPGEVVDFTAQLTSPPDAATRVRVGFADGRTAGSEH